MNYKHYIITRFNLPTNWTKDKLHNNILNEDWLTNRYYLFENYCFPSVFHQSNSNFEWWVYFDVNTAEFLKKKNKEYAANFSNFKPKYVKSYHEFQENYVKDILEDVKKNDLNYVLTTRLDNDDVISYDFVDIIQQNKFDQTKILEFPVGLTMNINLEKSLRKFYFRFNPFITLVYKVANKNEVEGVYAKEHGDWLTYPSEIVSEKPSWIQVIHEKNVFNREKGELVLSIALKRFIFKKPSFSLFYNLKIIKKIMKKYIKKIIKK